MICKVTNRRTAMLYTRCFLALVGVNLLLFICLLLTNLQSNLYLWVTFFGILGILFLLFKRTKFFEYENSGEVITIRNHHFWKTNKMEASLEFPFLKLDHYHLRKKTLSLIIKSDRGKYLTFSYRLCGLSSNQYKSLKKSLQFSKISISKNEF